MLAIALVPVPCLGFDRATLNDTLEDLETFIIDVILHNKRGLRASVCRVVFLALSKVFASITSLRIFAADPDVSMVVNSRNFGTAASRPALIITASAVPEPNRAFVLLTGLCGIAMRRARSTPLRGCLRS